MTWRIDLLIILSLVIVSSCVPNSESNKKQKQTSINSESTIMVSTQETSKDNSKDGNDKDTTPPSLPGLASFNKFYKASNFPFQFTWGVSVDANLSGYNYKICGTSDCKTSCKAQQSSIGTIPNGTIPFDGITEGMNYACVQAFDKYKNITNFVNVGSFTVNAIAPIASTFKLQSSGSHREFTNKTTISWIAETVKGATQMCLTNSQISANCNWIPTATSGTYSLPSGDGLKTVYLFYRGEDTNVSQPISASITLDQTRPANLRISSPYGFDAEIIGGSDTNFDHYLIQYCDSDPCSNIVSSFEIKSTKFNYGEMSSRYRTFWMATYAVDLADNMSSMSFRSFTNLTTPIPTTSTIPPSLPGFATFNKFYNASNFPFQFTWGASVSSSLAGYNYKICGTSDCRTSCKDQLPSIGTIPNGTITFDRVNEGMNYACVQAYDTKKNTTAFVNVGSFAVDTIAPTASTFALQSSGSHKVFINKSLIPWIAGTATGATQMCLTNSQSSTSCNWISSSTSGNYTLPSGGDGLKTVYLFYRDEALNVSKPISANITVDQTLPSNVALSLSNSNANIIGGSDINFDHFVIKFCDSPSCSNVISSFQSKTTHFSLSEMIALNKTFYTAVYAKDLADNISNLTILTYTAAPTEPTIPTIPTIPAPANPVIKDIAIAPSSMCIAFAGGIVKCVGYNKYGQLGFSSVIESSLTDLKTIPTHYFGADFEVAQLTTSSSFYCALSTKGAVKCWGMNAGGAIGQEASDAVLVLPPYTPSNVDVGSDRPVQLSTGGGYNCILTEYGDIKCWGYNAFAQLGLGHQNNIGVSPGQMGLNLKKVNLGTNIKATKVAAGGSFTCALLNTRQVKCWGMGALGNDTYRSNSGQLDDYIGSTPSHMGDNLLPVYLDEDVIDISAGATHMCALLASGKAKCWGNNMQAQLGQEDNDNRGDNTTTHSMKNLTPINFGSNKVLKIFAGPYHTCMILDNGKTKCWGNDSAGNLGQGHGNTAVYYTRLSTVDYLDFGTGVNAYKIYTGSSLSCALMTNGKVKCWGSGSLIDRAAQNNLGDEPNEMGDNLPYLDFSAVNTPTTPTIPDSPETTNAVVKAIALNGSSICIAFSAGRVKCMGFNSNGQMGYYSFEYGTMADIKNVPTHNFGPDFEVAQLTTEGLLYCALSTRGAVKCWGGDFQGSMGQGYNAGGMVTTYFTPANVDIGADRAIQIATSPAHSCIVTIKGEVKCWGFNFYGQLGIGNKNNIGDDIKEMGSNLKAVNLGTNLKALKVIVGNSYTCALLNNYKVKCWGWDSHGALGNNIAPSVPSFGGAYIGTSPTQMGDNLPPVYLEEDAVDISANGTHVCVLLASGKAKCWGDNAFLQLGLGDTVNRGNNDTDRAMENLSTLNFGSNKVLKIFAMPAKTCAILDNSDVKCWGRNYPGNLGQEKYDPIAIKLSDVKKLDLGTGNKVSTLYGSHSNICALLTSGKLKCFGDRDLINNGNRGIGDEPGEMGNNLPYIDLGI